MHPPLVSVIIPTYNRRRYLAEALESVWSQTYRQVEVIVVDDGSTDGTGAWLETYAHRERLRYLYQPNQGVSAARNQGIRLARGKYLAFLDSDDLFEPYKLEKQVAYLEEHPGTGLVHSHYLKFDDSGAHLGLRDTSFFTGRVYPEMLLYWSVLIAVPCVMAPAAVLHEVGGFDETLRWGEDLDLWRRIARCYPLACIPEALSKIRVHPDNASAGKAAALASFERYMHKAFAEDPALSPAFRRKALARMYANTSHNLLASGAQEEFAFARRLSLKAIRLHPTLLSAYLGLLGTFLSPSARRGLLAAWRRFRYRR